MALKHAGTTILAVAAVGLALGATTSARRSRPVQTTEKIQKPRDLREMRKARIEKLRQAIPGNGGESREGPSSADEEAFLQRAYPDVDIPAQRRIRSRESFSSFHRHGRRFGRRKPGVWSSIGPSSAIYQKTELRLTYVPDEYAASGRVTAMAIGPRCSYFHCPVYVAAAGGGVWKTDNGMSSYPRWTFLTGEAGINAIGSIVVDANDSTGRTLWVGTGEANASGDSAAGVGVYKSTDGGRSWTGPLGVGAFNNRSVGSIAVDPTNPNVVYVATTRGVRGVSSVTGGAVSLVPGAPRLGTLQIHGRGRDLDVHPQRQRGRLGLRRPGGGRQRSDALLPARRAAGGCRPLEPQHRLRGLLQSGGLALDERRCDLGPDQARPRWPPW